MTSEMSRLQQQIAFCEQLDGLKQVLRRNLVMDESRRENSAEHSWHIATMVMVLREYAAEPVDESKVMRMLLIHDVVEIIAGDTFCHDVEGNRDKEEREQRAADELFGLLPDDIENEIRALWDEFENGVSAEARFANSLDRFQVLLQNMQTRGGTWRIYGIDRKRVLDRVLPIKNGAPALWPLVEEYLEEACRKGFLKE